MLLLCGTVLVRGETGSVRNPVFVAETHFFVIMGGRENTKFYEFVLKIASPIKKKLVVERDTRRDRSLQIEVVACVWLAKRPFIAYSRPI